jgi:hypothetical protein
MFEQTPLKKIPSSKAKMQLLLEIKVMLENMR